MPIKPIVLQRRHAELGRIRLGDQVDAGNGRTRPNKLDRFRFTSASERFIRDLATLYGGEARQWDNNGKPEWEVYTTAQSIPVIAVKGGLSQWMETWSGGGCIHRCDGEQQVDGTICDPDDRNHKNAKPTTRLSLMLPELEAIGVWRMESHGWNAAAEIPAVAELAQFVGDLVPAHLHLLERRAVKDGKTSRFVVPVLDLQIGTERLKQIVNEKAGLALPAGSGAAAASRVGSPASAAALPAGSIPDYLAQAQVASTIETVRAIWNKANTAGHMTDQLNAELKLVGDALLAASQPDADGAVGAVVVDEGASAAEDALWQQILTEAGNAGKTLPQVTEDFTVYTGGVQPATASAGELAKYLEYLRTEAQVPA
jgi:hypothetical protein